MYYDIIYHPFTINSQYLKTLGVDSPWGAGDSPVVRVLASTQCGPGSYPGIHSICGLSLLLVLSFAPIGFSPGTWVLQFSALLKNQHFQIPIRPGVRKTKNHFRDVLPPNHYLFIYLFIYLHSGLSTLLNYPGESRFWTIYIHTYIYKNIVAP